MVQVCTSAGGTTTLRARTSSGSAANTKVYKRTTNSAADRLTLVIKPSNSARKKLRRGKTVRALFKLSFVPRAGGATQTRNAKLTLIQRPTPAKFRTKRAPNRQ